MLTYVTPVGRIAFNSLISPRVNPNSGLMEYGCGFVLSHEDSESILANIERALEEYRVKNPKFPATNEKLIFPYEPSMRKKEDGTKEPELGLLLWKFKTKAQYKDKNTGELVNRTPPAIYDSLGRVVTGRIDRIPTNSEGKMVYEIYVYDMQANKGVQLQIRGCQVSKLEKSGPELTPIEGGWTPDEDSIDVIGAVLAADA